MMQEADGMEALSLCGGGIRFDLFPHSDRASILAIKTSIDGVLSTEWLQDHHIEALLSDGMDCCFSPASICVLRTAAREFHHLQSNEQVA